MKVEVFEKNWTIEDVKSYPEKLFIFSDNNARLGKIGQSIIRDLPNAAGIRTKKGPSTKSVAYYYDGDFASNISNIRQDFLIIKSKIMSGQYSTVVLSQEGYGNGSEQLQKFAPKTFDFLCSLLKSYFYFDNILCKISKRIPGHDEIVSGKYISIDNKTFDSNVLCPVNNSFFRDDLLSKNLNTYPSLIISGNKASFTYPLNHRCGDIVILTVSNYNKYLICRVIDSYNFREVSEEMWSFFEGFDTSYIQHINMTNKEQALYQIHFEFICTLEQDGKMEFNEELFGQQNTSIPKEIKVVGNSLSNKKEEIPSGLLKIIKKKKLDGHVVKIPNSSKDFKLFKREKYQVYDGHSYHLVEYTKFLIFESVSILINSKNSFI